MARELDRLGNPIHRGLTPEQASANADAIVAHAVRQLNGLGVSDVDIVNRVLTHVAQSEGGRGGVYAWDVDDPEGVTWNYVQALAIEEDD